MCANSQCASRARRVCPLRFATGAGIACDCQQRTHVRATKRQESTADAHGPVERAVINAPTGTCLWNKCSILECLMKLTVPLKLEPSDAQ